MIVVDVVNGMAGVFSTVPPSMQNRPYLETDALPDGNGTLMVDVPNNRIWWEPVSPESRNEWNADRDYDPGEYLTADEVLYRVVLPILTGSRITVGTNVEATTIEAELASSKEE